MDPNNLLAGFDTPGGARPLLRVWLAFFVAVTFMQKLSFLGVRYKLICKVL